MQENSQTIQTGPAIAVASRGEFIVRVYSHLFAAILGFIGLEWALFQTGLAVKLAQAMLGVSWLIPLGGFMLVSWLATRFAHTAESTAIQYLALAAYVTAMAVIMVPLLVIANSFFPGTISAAGGLTAVAFTVLTGIVFITRKDFSFLRPMLMFGGVMALIAIVAGTLFGFNLGLWFSLAMVLLMAGAILYDTSKILNSYPEDRYVGAALQLFASVAMMFFYILRILISRD